MWLKVRTKLSVELDDNVFRRILNFYPEEKLLTRPVFSQALKDGFITFSSLKSEAETLFIPWQMFFLEETKLNKQLTNIENNRIDKLSPCLLSKRSGNKGGAYPWRLIDRCIRSQNFLVTSLNFPKNLFNGSLLGLGVNDAVNHILEYFSIDMDSFRGKSKSDKALEYLMSCISKKNINISRGTTAHGLMPCTINHRELYKNLSGFCLKDDRVPIVYLSTNEVVGEEVTGRQIYSLIYLVTLIGLEVYSLAINSKNIIRVPNGDKLTLLANSITSELLLPSANLKKYKGKIISWNDVRQISLDHKITPRAVLFRLKREKLISSEDHDILVSSNQFVPTTARLGNPKIETSVKKINGDIVYNSTNSLIKSGSLNPIQAQLVLFGRPDPIKWQEYKASTNL